MNGLCFGTETRHNQGGLGYVFDDLLSVSLFKPLLSFLVVALRDTATLASTNSWTPK